MIIHKNFVGGNIIVKEQTETDVYVENELRGTTEDWFYWAFCVEGAQGKTVTFHFQQHRLGYFGPAVSHDLENWHWLDSVDGNNFTYQFGENEDKVYFAHHMLYNMKRFDALIERTGYKVEELCKGHKTEKGRSVPCIRFGEGDKYMVLTARHHACESTGSYVLEGLLDELAKEPLEGVSVFCVPFVDYDGVLDGDQGKRRNGHDHNAEYAPCDIPVYPESAAIVDFLENHNVVYGFDFHSPWHFHGKNDLPFLVHNSIRKRDRLLRFADCLEKEMTPESLQYRAENDMPPMTDWNRQPSRGTAYNMMHRPGADIAVTLETTYAGLPENKVTQENMVELGHCFARAIKRYIREGQK